MNIFLKKIALFIGLVVSSCAFAQQTQQLQISVLTCGTGNEVYSIFGHTAIRVIDSTNHTDVIYNYGTFNFDDPNFLPKFIRGKLDYFLSLENAQAFFAAYDQEGRFVKEQILLLSNVQKQELYNALILNATEKNKYYKYDFLFDNCTTKVRDLLVKYAHLQSTQRLVLANTTYRDMIHIYLNKSGMCFTTLGIDIVLGSNLDKKVSNLSSLFLPDILLQSIDTSNPKIASASQTLVAQKQTEYLEKFKISTVTLLSFCFLLVAIGLLKNNMAIKYTSYVNTFILYVSGLMGCLLLFMWLCTDHKTCGNNFNLLWALPTNLIAAYFVNKKPKWLQYYFIAGLVFIAFLALISATSIQAFGIDIFIVVAIVAITYLRLIRTIKYPR
jgi:Domain of unknown function (DUF4105)